MCIPLRQRPAIALGALALLACVAAPALAQDVAPGQAPAAGPGGTVPGPSGIATGEDLVKGCKARLKVDPAGEPQLNGGRCKEYIIDYVTRQRQNPSPKPEEFFCTNGTVSFGRVAQVVIDHGRDNPDLLPGPVDPFMASALRKAYPCPDKTPS